jgi:hypothetical protein
MNEFTKRVDFTPAYNKEDYGIHPVEIKFLLSKPDQIVILSLYTDWYLPDDQHRLNESKFKHNRWSGGRDGNGTAPWATDLGYHSAKPVHSWQKHSEATKCQYTSTGSCHYDGSSINCDRTRNELLWRGDKGVWEDLERYWNAVFGLESLPFLEEEEPINQLLDMTDKIVDGDKTVWTREEPIGN